MPNALIREATWLNAWAIMHGGDNREAELATATAMIADALALITDQIQGAGEADHFEEDSVAILALNALSWNQTDVIEVRGDPLELIDPDSPDETLNDAPGRLSRLYLVNVLACGYRAYRTRKG